MARALYNNNIRTGNSVGRFVCGSHDGFLKESDKKKNCTGVFRQDISD